MTIESDSPRSQSVKVLVYSDDVATRREVMNAVGHRPGKGLPSVTWHEVATAEGVKMAVDEDDFALLVLDGEAAKEGGMSVCRRLKVETEKCPPVLLLVARPQDQWLANWSQAESVVSYPLEPRVIQKAIAELLRERGFGAA